MWESLFALGGLACVVFFILPLPLILYNLREHNFLFSKRNNCHYLIQDIRNVFLLMQVHLQGSSFLFLNNSYTKELRFWLLPWRLTKCQREYWLFLFAFWASSFAGSVDGWRKSRNHKRTKRVHLRGPCLVRNSPRVIVPLLLDAVQERGISPRLLRDVLRPP